MQDLPRGEQQLLQGFKPPLPGAELSSIKEAQPQVGLQRHFQCQLQVIVLCFNVLKACSVTCDKIRPQMVYSLSGVRAEEIYATFQVLCSQMVCGLQEMCCRV